MKKKNILIIVLCVVIVGLLSVIGVLVYKNVQEKKKQQIEAYRKAHSDKYIKFTDNAGNDQVEKYFNNMKFIKGVDILEYDKDNNVVNKYSDIQSIGTNKLKDVLIKTQKDTKKIQVHLWIKYLDEKEYSFSSFNLKRDVAKKSKDGDTTYINVSSV
jgi:hypothetical protein